MTIDKLNLNNPNEIEEIKNFLADFQLKYDSSVDYTMVARENQKIVATASKDKNIVKCLLIITIKEKGSLLNFLLLL